MMRSKRSFRPALFLSLFLLTVTFLIGQAGQLRLDAERLQAEGEELFSKNTPEDREKAFPKIVEAVELWEKLGDDERLVMSLNRLNDISFYRSDFKQCVFYSSRILPLAQKLGNRNLEGSVLGNLGFYHHLLGESRKGLEFLERSAEILGEIGEIQRQSTALTNIGQVYYNLGDTQRAVDMFIRSADMRRSVADRKGEGVVLNNLGYVFNEGGEKRKALEFYERALVIATEAEDHLTEATLFSNIGSIYQDWSEFQKAFDYYIKSLELRRKIGDIRGQAMSMHNVASIYQTLGDNVNALNFLNQALEIYQKGGFRREEALALSSIGSIYVLSGDRKRGFEFNEKALEIQKSLDNKSGFSFILQNLGKIYLDGNENEKALEYFEQALKYAEESNDIVSAAQNLVSLARAYERINDPRKAEAAFERAVSILEELQMPFELANALYYSARFEENRGRRDSAIEKISKVLQVIEDLRSSISSQNWQTGFFAEQQKYYEFYISLLTVQHKRFPEKGYGVMALEASERARARSLLDTLGELRSDVRFGVPPELLDEESGLRSTINAKDRQRLDALKEGANERAVQFEKELTEQLRKYEVVQTRIRQASPGFATLNRPEPLDVETIRSQVLDDDTVLLEYFLGEERSFLFLVTKSHLEIFELPKRESIETAVRSLIEHIKARAQDLPNETISQRASRLRRSDTLVESGLQEIGDTLLSPVAGSISNKRLLIVASGILQYLPFAALPAPQRAADASESGIRRRAPSRTTTREKGPYLVETSEIVHLPSASVLPSLRQLKASRSEDRDPVKNVVSIFADPVFAADDPRVKLTTNGETAATIMRAPSILLPTLRSELGRLRFSRTEAQAISELVGKEQRFIALDFAANLSEVTSDDVRSSRIVHLATHGVVNSQFPMLTSLVFSMIDENGKKRDGHLRLHEVYNLRLEADLVVLSACETAIGKDVRGEGLVGLTRGFMHAGAPSVVASLWRVDDRATADLMKRFYQRMFMEGLEPAAALRQAQLSMLKERTTAQPFYWAGFTLQGDWK